MSSLEFSCTLVNLEKYYAQPLQLLKWRRKFKQASSGLDEIFQLTII